MVDSTLNGDKPYMAAVHDDDRRALRRLATRRRMPVLSDSKAAYSADHGCEREASLSRYVVKAMIAAASVGNATLVRALSGIGAHAYTPATVNKILKGTP